jgi:hypothetical protein
MGLDHRKLGITAHHLWYMQCGLAVGYAELQLACVRAGKAMPELRMHQLCFSFLPSGYDVGQIAPVRRDAVRWYIRWKIVTPDKQTLHTDHTLDMETLGNMV